MATLWTTCLVACDSLQCTYLVKFGMWCEPARKMLSCFVDNNWPAHERNAHFKFMQGIRCPPQVEKITPQSTGLLIPNVLFCIHWAKMSKSDDTHLGYWQGKPEKQEAIQGPSTSSTSRCASIDSMMLSSPLRLQLYQGTLAQHHIHIPHFLEPPT